MKNERRDTVFFAEENMKKERRCGRKKTTSQKTKQLELPFMNSLSTEEPHRSKK